MVEVIENVPVGQPVFEINDKVYCVGEDERLIDELKKVQAMAKKESSALQCDKILLVLFMITVVITVNLL